MKLLSGNFHVCFETNLRKNPKTTIAILMQQGREFFQYLRNLNSPMQTSSETFMSTSRLVLAVTDMRQSTYEAFYLQMKTELSIFSAIL